MQSPKAEAGDAAQRALDLPLLVPPEKIVLVMADMEEAFTRWQPGAWKPLAEEPGPAFEAKLAQALVEAVAKANPNYVVVLINGGALGIDWIKKNSPAVVEAFYP